MPDSAARRYDDTVQSELADDLLGSHDPADGGPESIPPSPAASTWPDPDADDYLAPAARRGKLTTGLLLALIFLVGILAGTILTMTLAPAPAPQIVYVLNDAATSAPPATPSPPR